MQIANPIYDVVFKYLMDDNQIAKLMLSAIIGEEIIERGKHEELLAKKGFYHNLYMSQFKGHHHLVPELTTG